MKKKLLRVRVGAFYKETVNICKHLKLRGEITTDEFPRCEYVELVEIYCPTCKKWVKFEIAIN